MSEDRQHPGSSRVNRAETTPDSPGGQKQSEPLREQTGHGNLFEPGAHVGRYRLLAPLAQGGMAQVWAAKPEGPGFARTIALKLIRHEYAADEEYSRMFIDEATVAASIHHPNVCETYELGREEKTLFMAIEWIAGDSLAGVLHRDTGLEPIAASLAARIVADVCAGLHAAHEVVGPDGVALGVVHRDVSPPNILLSLHGQVKVSDFGIAKARLQLHSMTRTGEIKGKFAYIAPEQIGGKGIDRRADIFALGCVLYVATLGLRPFGSGPRAMGKILTGEYKRPRTLVERYPEELERIIERCLRRLPDERYQTADEMRLDLERWLLNCDTPVGTKDLAALVKERLDPKKRKVVETLLRSNQFLPDAMVYQLVSREVEETPTANSSVMFGPVSNPSIDVSPPLRSGQRPMVRFTALGRPLYPCEPSENNGDGFDASIERTAISEELTTADRSSQRNLLQSQAPRQMARDAVPTYRPPRLGSDQVLQAGGKAVERARHRLRRQFWIAALVLGAVAVGWASCQYLPS